MNLPVVHLEIDTRLIHIGRDDFDFHPLAVFEMLDERVLALEVPSRNIARQAGPP